MIFGITNLYFLNLLHFFRKHIKTKKHIAESMHKLYKKLRVTKTLATLRIFIATLSTLSCLQHTSPRLGMAGLNNKLSSEAAVAAVATEQWAFKINLTELNQSLPKGSAKWPQFFEERQASFVWQELCAFQGTELAIQLDRLKIKHTGITNAIAAGIIRYLAHYYAYECKKLTIVGGNHTTYKITKLDPALKKLKTLEHLAIQHNSLCTLPTWIEELVNLKALVINEKLKILPKEIRQLRRLKTLKLPHNQLETLPKEIEQLRDLEFLDLSHNQLKTLPEEIGQLRKLKTLKLPHNQLETLPDTTGYLKKLQKIYLEGNQWLILPQELIKLRSQGLRVFFPEEHENIFIEYHPELLFQWVREGSTPSVALHYRDAPDINRQDQEGNSVLHIAAHKGYTDIVAVLISHPEIDMTIQNKAGETALDLAKEQCHKAWKTALDLAKKQRHKTWKTALDLAKDQPHEDIIELLQKYFICILCNEYHAKNAPYFDASDINRQDEAGNSVLHIAVNKGRKDIVAVLIRHPEIDMTIQNKASKTALDLAKDQCDEDIIELLQYPQCTRCQEHHAQDAQCCDNADFEDADFEDADLEKLTPSERYVQLFFPYLKHWKYLQENPYPQGYHQCDHCYKKVCMRQYHQYCLTYMLQENTFSAPCPYCKTNRW